MASAEARQAAIDKAVIQVAKGNGFIRPVSKSLADPSKAPASATTKKIA